MKEKAKITKESDTMIRRIIEKNRRAMDILAKG